MPHLDEGVQSLAVRLQELRLNVQHVNLRPGDHYSDEDTVCGAQTLKRQKLCLYRRTTELFYRTKYDNINLFL